VSVCFVFWEGKHKNKIVLERQYRGYLVYFTIIFSVKNLKPKGIEKSKNYNKKKRDSYWRRINTKMNLLCIETKVHFMKILILLRS
jgi:hypothetical protein